jgi:hypothetical protein
MLTTSRLFHLRRCAALIALVSLAACGACNCNVPAFTSVAGAAAGATPVPAGGVVVPPVVVVPVLPPGVVPPAPTPPPAVLSCNQGAGSIALGPALAPFALLAGATITNTGLSVVTYASGATTGSFNDDLIGVSPGTSVIGFYPPGVDADGPAAIYAIGAGYSNIPAVPAAAEAALTTAFNTAAGLAATTTFPGGQDLSLATVPGYPTGTLPPGVYKSASSLSIMSGNLTLNGGGNPQSVFVFQAGSTFTTTLNGGAGGNIILTNGATACNIYFQTGSSAVLGGQTFYGDILALGSVTLTSSTQFTGRALASTGAVTIATGSLITNPGGK